MLNVLLYPCLKVLAAFIKMNELKNEWTADSHSDSFGHSSSSEKWNKKDVAQDF